MSIQPSVVEYFNSRKRALEDVKKSGSGSNSKVLVLDESLVSDSHKTPPSDLKSNGFTKKLVYSTNGLTTPQTKSKISSSKVKSGHRSLSKSKKDQLSNGYQTDIRKSLFKEISRKEEIIRGTDLGQVEKLDKPKLNDGASSEDKSNNGKNDAEKPCEPNVPFSIRGALSPQKCKKTTESDKMKEEESKPEPQSSSSTAAATTSSSRKELNLGNIKAMMSRSSRLEEMKAALNRFNENKAKLSEMQAKATEKSTSEGVDSFELEVASSPNKTPSKASQVMSPQRIMTPSRLFSTPPAPLSPSPIKSPMKSPAFQRYQALVSEGRPALVLPFKYRSLAELFRCIDTVASMLHNRKETITLSKLKPGVQEISRKNLTEYHLGQIKTVFPNAFQFKMEKMHSFGSAEKYELVITPLLDNADKGGGDGEGKHAMMSPSVLLARRRTLYTALLELTKQYHQEFLMSLEPPLNIPLSRLSRWHPEFAVDDVPDIVSAALPKPPNVERVTSAKDVLERAHNLFLVNPRMERALRKVSENHAAAVSPAVSPTPPSVKSALHGVPASLLERVRAKQAARALEAMTRTPDQAKEVVRLSRLPEIARIVRNLFVTEKKSVLPREMVLKKLADSYREDLSQNELDDHLKLLDEKTPGWLTFCNLRKTDYVKLSRSADMNRIMTRLETLAAEKCV